MRAVALLLLAWACAAAEPWGPNLWPDGSFENGQSWGAATTVVPEGCAGTWCLAATAAPKGQIASPVVAAAPGWYLLSFWYRHEFSPSDPPLCLAYIDRRTGAGRRDSVYWYYQPQPESGQWASAFVVFRLRPGDTGVQLRFDAHHLRDRWCLDAVHLRALQPPANPGAVTSVVADAYGTERIADPAAPNGFAWHVVEGHETRGTKAGGGLRFDNPPGLYRATYRFRQEQPASGTALGLRLAGDNGITIDDLQPGDFAPGDGYQEFSVYWVYPYGTGSFPAWDWLGRGSYRFASLTLTRLQPLTYQESWAALADDVALPAVRPAAAPALTPGTLAWVAHGLFTPETGILAALAEAGLPGAQSFPATRPGGALQLVPPMPALTGLRVVVLSDVPARAFPPVEQLALQRFVREGGTLLVFGGLYGFGHGGLQGTFIGDLLPVTIARTFDLVPTSAPLTEPTWWFPAQLGGCAWVHEVMPRPGATVLWRSGRHPGLVTWPQGTGRVIAVPATVLGEPAQPYWRQPAWQEELRRLLCTAP